MSHDFRQRIKNSIGSGALAVRNNDEIDSTIRQIAEQIEEVTDGKVIVEVAYLYDIGGRIARDPGDAENAPTFEAIVARAADSSDENDNGVDFILAEVRRGARGYPCTVLFEGYEYQCADAEALGLALLEMVETPSTGMILSELQDSDYDRRLGPSRRPL